MRRQIGWLGRNTFLKAMGLGVISLTLYGLLFTRQGEIMDLALHGRWGFMVPVSIAFTFSLVHGLFTAAFWEALGVKARR